METHAPFCIMPTIEIVCLEQKEPLALRELSFAVEAETPIVSHRGLFYEEFKVLNGYIYHLGSPNMRQRINGFFYAAELLDWGVSNSGALKFLPEFAPEVRQLCTDLLKASPVQTILFSSDYQFGPKERRHERPLKHETFWRKHDAGELRLNARYIIRP